MSLSTSTIYQTSTGIKKHSWIHIHSGCNNTMNGQASKSTTLFPMEVNEASSTKSESEFTKEHNPQKYNTLLVSEISKCNQKRKSFNSHYKKYSGSGMSEDKSQQKNGISDSPDLQVSSPLKANENSNLTLGHIPRYIKCFTCSRIIKEDHFSEHLLFGAAKCSLCNVIFRDCQGFQIWATEYALGNVICNHLFTYLNDTIDYLTKHLTSNHPENTLLISKIILLESYMNKLKSLETGSPWQSAILKCRAYIKAQYECDITKEKELNSTKKDIFGISKRKEFNVSLKSLDNNYRTDFDNIQEECIEDVLTQDYDIGQLEEATEFVRLPDTFCMSESQYPILKPRKVALPKIQKDKSENSATGKTSTDCTVTRNTNTVDNESVEYVPIPVNGFYYVSTKPLEECPNCYETLCPSQFSVNVITFLMTVVCIGCDLTIYITSGSSNVQIVMESKEELQSPTTDSSHKFETRAINKKPKKHSRRRKSKPGTNFLKK